MTHDAAHLSDVQLHALRQDLREQLERRSRHVLGLRAEAQDGSGADDTWQELLVTLTAATRVTDPRTAPVRRPPAAPAPGEPPTVRCPGWPGVPG